MSSPLLFLLAPSFCFAFSGDVHKAISLDALADAKFDEAAAAQVAAGNLQTDKDEFWDVEAHFDNEAFSAGSRRLRLKLKAGLDALDSCNAALAREQLGRAMHPVQDFFAHSNWVENHAASDPAGLLSLKDAEPGVACEPKGHQGALTSGYYYRDDKQAAPAGKCLHAVLHKDDASRPMHKEARERALAESKALLKLFDDAVLARFAPLGRGEAAYRLRLLRDMSPGFAEERNACRPQPGSARGPLAMPPSVGARPWP